MQEHDSLPTGMTTPREHLLRRLRDLSRTDRNVVAYLRPIKDAARTAFNDAVNRALSSSQAFNGSSPQYYCVYAPLAVVTLAQLTETFETNDVYKRILLRDFSCGLSFLYAKGIVRRDISPKNLAVTALYPPKGLIIDLDAATRFPNLDGNAGTPP